MSDLRKKLLEAKIASFEKTGKVSVLSGAMDDAKLTSEAGVLSDLWNTLWLLSIPKAERRLRVNLLSYAKESRKRLRDIELKVLNKDVEGAIHAYYSFASDFLGSFVEDFEKLKDLENDRSVKQLTAPQPDKQDESNDKPQSDDITGNIGEMIPPSGEGETIHDEAPPVSSEKPVPDLDQLKNDVEKQITAINSAKIQVTRHLRSQNPGSGLAAEIDARFSELNQRALGVKSVEDAVKLQQDIKALGKLLRNQLDKIEKSASCVIDDDIRKVSKNTLERWFKRKLLNMSRSMRDKIYYNIVQDIINLDPMLKNISSNLKDSKKQMRDFDSDIKSIMNKIQSTNKRLLMLTKSIRATQKSPNIKREVLTNLKDLNKQLQTAMKVNDDPEE